MFMQFSDKRTEVESFGHTERPVKKDGAAVPLGNAVNPKGLKNQPPWISRDIALHRSSDRLIISARLQQDDGDGTKKLAQPAPELHQRFAGPGGGLFKRRPRLSLTETTRVRRTKPALTSAVGRSFMITAAQ